MSIGVIITNINRVFFPQVIKGIQDAATQNGYSITFCNSNDSFEMEQRFVQMLESSWLDGIILDSVADVGQKEYFKKLSGLGNEKKRIPVVSIERRIDDLLIDSVVVNNEDGGSMAARHLIECGCSKIAHITGPTNSCMVLDRLNGCKKELQSRGMQLSDSRVVEGDFSPLSGYHAVKQLLLKGVDFDGIFAANDQMAIGAIKAIKEQGYHVPEDIRVVGFDNTFVSSIVEPSLTTINVPKYKMGTSAVEALMKRIENDSGEAACIELPINLVVRQSTELRGDKNWDLYGW
jgi:DNA-binding LacI/PurR family transcriptional regulator